MFMSRLPAQEWSILIAPLVAILLEVLLQRTVMQCCSFFMFVLSWSPILVLSLPTSHRFIEGQHLQGFERVSDDFFEQSQTLNILSMCM